MDPSSNNHFTSRRQEVYSVQHQAQSEPWDVSGYWSPLGDSDTCLYSHRKYAEILQSQNSATDVIKEL